MRSGLGGSYATKLLNNSEHVSEYEGQDEIPQWQIRANRTIDRGSSAAQSIGVVPVELIGPKVGYLGKRWTLRTRL
jgi:hypothetical protein